MGLFSGFLDDEGVELVGVEAGGRGRGSGQHAARLAYDDATIGVAQGYKTYFLQDRDGQMQDTHSVSAGLDYVGVSPILSHLHESGRLIPALESSHAFAQAYLEAPTMGKDENILINMSGRADKDIFTVADAVDDPKWRDFIIDKAADYRREMSNG